MGIWSKGIRKMHEQRVADCGGNFVPNKKASPQASERRIYEGGSLKSKNAEKRAYFRRTRKSPPQFTLVNEEGIYRSATPKTPLICVFDYF